MTLDLTKKVEVYFNEFPLKSVDNDVKIVMEKHAENNYLFVIVQNDVPADIHHVTTDRLREEYGSLSEFAKQKKGYVMPFLVDAKSNEAIIAAILQDGGGKEIRLNASTLKDTNWKVGGMAVPPSIASIIVKEFENNNYDVIRKYK